MRPQVLFFFFLKTFLDSKQFIGTTHKYYDRGAVILSLLIGLGIQPTGNGERSFTTCWNSVLKGSPSESILCPTIVEVHSDEVQSSKECLLLFAAWKIKWNGKVRKRSFGCHKVPSSKINKIGCFHLSLIQRKMKVCNYYYNSNDLTIFGKNTHPTSIRNINNHVFIHNISRIHIKNMYSWEYIWRIG